MKTKSHVFKTFPEFSKLTFQDRDAYNKLIADFPPIGDYSFPTLMTWWGQLDYPRVAHIGKNLVISFWMPGNDDASGLSVLGTDRVDESIAEVLDYLRAKKEPSKLVHINEFVVSHMRYPDLYKIKPERDFDECIINLKQLATITQILPTMRWKVRRFSAYVDDQDTVIKKLNIGETLNQRLLLDAAHAWKSQGKTNNTSKHEVDSCDEAIRNAPNLGFECVCLFVSGTLQAFIIYSVPSQDGFVITEYARFNYDTPFIFEYAVHRFAQWFLEAGFTSMNILEDGGNPILRNLKISIGPINFFRKYTIETKA